MFAQLGHSAHRTAFLIAIAFLCSSALAGDDLTIEQRKGREIYRRGTLAGLSVGTASIGEEGVPLPSSSFSCANCHGIRGDGGSESGIQPPPLNWKFLTSPAMSRLTNRRRVPYTPATLRQAITSGRDPSGAPLHAGMPHFAMEADQLNDLIAYLERIGDDGDTDPGVSPTSIRIGVALPLSGPLKPAGESIRETLERLFASASRNGGIYGRTVELVAEDSRGTPVGLRDATRRLITEENVFAMTASLEFADSEESNHLLETEGVPLIGPVTLSPHTRDSPNRYVFYLLPSLYEQARAVVDFLAARDPQRPKLAVIYGDTHFDQDVVDGLRSQAGLRALPDVIARRYNSQAVAEILESHPDYLFFSGDGAGLTRVAQELEHAGTAPSLIGFISTAQSGISLLPANVAAKALFVAPALPPNMGESNLNSILGAGGPSPSYLGLRAAAFAGGTVLLHALRESGAHLNRDYLVRNLEGLQHFETGVTPPVSFGPNLRVGSSGCVMMAFDREGHYLSVISDWIVPQN